jgi:hypothetical protein
MTIDKPFVGATDAAIIGAHNPDHWSVFAAAFRGLALTGEVSGKTARQRHEQTDLSFCSRSVSPRSIQSRRTD